MSIRHSTTATAFVSGLPDRQQLPRHDARRLDRQHDPLRRAGELQRSAGPDGDGERHAAVSWTAADHAGQVAINGRLDNCPYITALSANALQAPVGQLDHGQRGRDRHRIRLTSSPTPGRSPGPATGVGTLGTPAAATTTFTCTGLGAVKLSIVISDSVCGETRTNAIPLTCVRAGTGGTAGTAGTGGAGGSARLARAAAPGGHGRQRPGRHGVAAPGGHRRQRQAGTGGGGTGGGGTGAMACTEPDEQPRPARSARPTTARSARLRVPTAAAV